LGVPDTLSKALYDLIRKHSSPQLQLTRPAGVAMVTPHQSQPGIRAETIMQARDFLDSSIRAFSQTRNRFNHPRLLLFAGTLILFGIALSGLEKPPEPSTVGYSDVLGLSLPERLAPPVDTVFKPTGITTDEPAEPVADEDPWDRVTVRSGQTLDAIFRKQGFSVSLLHQILALNMDTKNLTRIKPGDEFEFRRHADGNLREMRYAMDEDRWLVIDNKGDDPVYQSVEREITTELNEARGTIRSSLFIAGKSAGLNDAMIMKLANIFGWDIDFVLDIREGDQFYLLYEKRYREGKFLSDGEILAASFVNQGEKFQAVQFETTEGRQHFAPDGHNMRKAFLRAPLNFSYVSSSFNPKRFHPILKRVKAHNGIDYRAPTGTPVYAAGDGKVIRSAYSSANGHHVFIQHANSIVTKYLHFSKRRVNQGQRVRQGQVIGLVGSTGLSQAPHLHYEFVLNGVHRNPRTVSLPKALPLEGTELVRFQTHAAPYLSQLSRLESASMYAISE
jgi:murein DD-endopeptidase MepM/ murein hydrolase activator NlpD